MPAPPAAPRLLGRLANRIVLGGLLLSLAAAALMMVQNADAFPLAMVAVAFFGVLLAALPALVFLFYSFSSGRRPPPQVPRQARIAIYFSSVMLFLVAAWLVRGGTGLDGAPALLAVGAGVGAVGILAAVRMWRFTPGPGAAETQLTYGRSSVVGAFLFLLVVVMLPKFAGVNPPNAYRAVMTTDLRNLATAQEAFFADSLRYASAGELGALFHATSYDSIVIVVADSGWRATATHPYLAGQACGMWVGTRPPDGMHGATEGEPTCWKVP
jgi:hypothetical protein